MIHNCGLIIFGAWSKCGNLSKIGVLMHYLCLHFKFKCSSPKRGVFAARFNFVVKNYLIQSLKKHVVRFALWKKYDPKQCDLDWIGFLFFVVIILLKNKYQFQYYCFYFTSNILSNIYQCHSFLHICTRNNTRMLRIFFIFKKDIILLDASG